MEASGICDRVAGVGHRSFDGDFFARAPPTDPPFRPWIARRDRRRCAIAAAAFAYTAGWLSPQRLTPDRLVDALAPPSGPALGHRRNHAKGICFTGVFEANGAGAELSTAQAFAKGQYPVIGRFNLGTPNPDAADATVRVRGIGVLITTPDGQQWRMAMIDPPFFPVSNPHAFYELLEASASKDPGAMGTFAARASRDRRLRRLGEERAVDRQLRRGARTTASTPSFSPTPPGPRIRCGGRSFPRRSPVPVPPEELAKRGPNFLEQEIAERIKKRPLHWTLSVTVANPGDPTADPSKAWPDDRRKVEVGTLTVQTIIPEADGPCRDINYDPAVLPNGISTSDDPFPAARSSAYRVSFDRRTAEAKDYPRTATGGNP